MKGPLSRTLHDLVREQSELRPTALAVVSGDRQISYGELHARSQRMAAALASRGIKRGDRIGLLVSNRLEWLTVCLGASAAGAVTVAFSTWSTRQELQFLLADSRIVSLFALARFGDRDYAHDLADLAPELTTGGASQRFPALREIILIDADDGAPFLSLDTYLDSAASVAGDLPPGIAASAGDDCLVLYTSGSSSHPKAVRLEQFGIIENGFGIGERQGLGPNDRVLLSPPLFWSYGSANALPAALTHGAALVLQEKFSADEAIALIERHACTSLYTLPGMTSAIGRSADYRRDRLQTLRTGLTIGSPQDFLAAVEILGATELCNIYGATETYGNCCVTWHHWRLERRSQCQGTPLPGNVLRFVDVETGQPVGPQGPGLVEIKGYVTPGYSGASSDQNEFAFTEDGFYRTGDVGRLDDDGAFVFIGRNSEMIKRAGINVSPAEVEDILRLHPGVELVGVVGAPDSEKGERVIAFVVPKLATVTSEELLAHCRSIASKYKVPDRIELCASLPTTPTGKLQRRALKQQASELVVEVRGRHG